MKTKFRPISVKQQPVAHDMWLWNGVLVLHGYEQKSVAEQGSTLRVANVATLRDWPMKMVLQSSGMPFFPSKGYIFGMRIQEECLQTSLQEDHISSTLQVAFVHNHEEPALSSSVTCLLVRDKLRH